MFHTFFLLNYKSFHFSPSSQHPPTLPTPSLPPSPSLRAVRVSCPVGSSSSSPLPPGPGRWVSKQTGSQNSSICRGNKSQCHCQWLFRKAPGQPHSENLVGSRPHSVPVQLALVNSHYISPLVSVGDRIPRSPFSFSSSFCKSLKLHVHVLYNFNSYYNYWYW